MKLMEIYQKKLEDRKQRQKEAVKLYLRNSKVRKVVEKLEPYRDEIFNLVDEYGLDETRKVINTTLSLKIREETFKEVIQQLKNTKK